MARRHSTRGIRKNRTYTYEQLAEKVGVSPQTVRKTKPRGLRVMEGARPHLVLGADAIAFAERLRVRDSVRRQVFWDG